MSNAAVAPSVRAAVFTAVCTALALGAHLPMAAGGVPCPAVALGAGAVFAAARAAAGRERGLAAVGVLVGASQFGLHLVFDAAQRMAAPGSGGGDRCLRCPRCPRCPRWPRCPRRCPTSSMPSMPSMPSTPSMHDPLAALSMAPMGPAATSAGAHAVAAPMGLSAGMTTAHVLAALLAAWWLRRGEAAVFACARWAGALARATWRTLAWLLATPAPDGTPSRAAAPRGPGAPRGFHSRLLRFSVIGRGPPTAPAV